MRINTKEIRFYSTLCLLLAFVLSFYGCSTDTSSIDSNRSQASYAEATEPYAHEETPPLSLSDLTLVRHYNSTSNVIDAVMSLNRAVKSKTGSSLPISTDSTETTSIANKILIATTNIEQVSTISNELGFGEYSIRTVSFSDGESIVICGYNEAAILKAIDVFCEMISDDTLFDSDGYIKALNIQINMYENYKDFELVLGDEIVVAQGDETYWGYYQFPNIVYTSDGRIMINWSVHNDTIYAWSGPSLEYSYSSDGGNTWSEKSHTGSQAVPEVVMSNGKYFAGFGGKETMTVDYLDKYTPKASKDGVDIYLASDIEELDKSFIAYEYDPATQKQTSFDVNINWPDMPVSVYNGCDVMSVQRQFSISNPNMCAVALDDGLYFVTYARSIYRHGFYSVFVFRSTDNARSWDMIKEIAISDDDNYPNMEGFNEPSINLMPDGSVIILMRIGNGEGFPCYITRSTDNCKTWSKPEIFGEIGVLPQILTLDCGVTVSTFGRPRIYIRATSDYSGVEWEDPIEIELSEADRIGTHSCCYTRLLPLNENTLLMVYTDFNYPNQNGEGTLKTILVRTVTIVPKE